MQNHRAIRLMLTMTALGAWSVPAAAQYSAYPAPLVAADPGSALAAALHTLATQPKDLIALLAAGRASLDLGDLQAAAGFFGRAEEYYPSSPAAKIGVGAAKTMMGDASGAMVSFNQAKGLGAPQSMLALDRGLAFDLLGQQAKAQSDYRVAMFGTQANEARRRLALSLAISKDAKGATTTLEPLLARRDPAAVRTNAFVLALAGDRDGARRAIDAALPGAGARFEPFFRMLPMLRADEKAMAVHLGEFPRDAAQRGARAEPVRSSPVVSLPNKRELQIEPSRANVAIPAPAPKIETTSPPVQVAEAPRGAVSQSQLPSTLIAMGRPAPDPSLQASKPIQLDIAPVAKPTTAKEPDPTPRPVIKADGLAPAAEAKEPLIPVSAGPALNLDDEPIVTEQVALAPPPRPTPEVEIRPPPAPKPKVELAKPNKADPPQTKEPPKAKEPPKSKVELAKAKKVDMPKSKEPASTHYVQLASGANADRMGIEYRRIKAKKPALFAGRTVRVTNGKELFRLVVGPFKSKDDSGAFVNQLSKAGIDGFNYTAPDGMTFDKLPTK